MEEYFYLCIFDVMMFKKDGFIFVCDIWVINQEVFILFFIVKLLIEDKVEGFKVGVDDYLIKFFVFDELIMCVKVFFKCVNIVDEFENKIVKIVIYVFDMENYMFVYVDFQKILIKKEVMVLKLFCQFKNNVVLWEIILIVVWGQDDYFVG